MERFAIVRVPVVLGLLGAAGCGSESAIEILDPVSLTLDSPTYGQFLGDGPIRVSGRVSPPAATVKIDGQTVVTDAEGRFETSVPFAKRYHIVNAEAAAGGTYTRERVPVFDGQDPALSWPEGITARVTPAGLLRLGQGLGAMIDGTGWDTQIGGVLPAIDTDVFDLIPSGVTHSPTTVDLLPAEGGIDAALAFHDAEIGYTASIDLFGVPLSAPLSIGFGEIAIGARAIPDLDDAGLLSLSLAEATIRMDEPVIVVFGLESGPVLGWLMDQIFEVVVEPLGETLLGFVLDQFGTIPLGGPFAFSTDMMGAPLDIRLSDVYGDLDGLGAEVGVGLGVAAPVGPLVIPAPDAEADPVHLAIGLHEGLLQVLLDSAGLMDMLAQDIVLPGAIGELVGNGIRNLPGGGTAPAGEGWCLTLAPTEARVARLQEGTEPLGTLYMPDMGVTVGIVQGGACQPWLAAELAAEIGIKVKNGTKIGVDIGFAEGAIVSYGATGDWEEAEVVAGLSTFLEGATGLLGGMIEFDLADLAGGLGGTGGETDPLAGALGDLQPAIVSSTPMMGEDGEPIEGLYSVGIQLWEPVGP